MSRHDLKNQRLRDENSQILIYDELVRAFTSRKLEEPLSVEILHESHSLPEGVNVLVEENTIGVSRKTLVRAFLIARRILFDNGAFLSENEQAILDASTVILFYDPEHLSGANARKRVILNRLKHSAAGGQQTISLDLWFVEGLLTSFLPRHTKSPTLWSHRRWLLQQSSPLSDEKRIREFSNVALMAAEHHPRNYYAWDYLRWWTAMQPDVIDLFEKGSGITLHVQKESPDMLSIVAFYLSWCLKHPSDTSGWSFLLWLLTRWSPNTSANVPDARPEVVRRVLDAARTLRLRNESLWFFLRTLVAMIDLPPELGREYEEDLKAISS